MDTIVSLRNTLDASSGNSTISHSTVSYSTDSLREFRDVDMFATWGVDQGM